MPGFLFPSLQDGENNLLELFVKPRSHRAECLTADIPAKAGW